jgi:hypothetical protein
LNAALKGRIKPIVVAEQLDGAGIEWHSVESAAKLPALKIDRTSKVNPL